MLNALLTTSSSLRKCSRLRISGPSAQAMSPLRIEGMMKPSPTVHGSGSGKILESAAGPRTRSSQRVSDSRVCSLDFVSNLNFDGAVSHSSEWAITQPIQLQDSFSTGAKPSVYLLFGEWVIARAELLVEQFSDLFRCARSLDLVQGSSHLFVEPGIRVQRLSHLSFSYPKANVIRSDQMVGFPTAPIKKRMQGSGGTSGNQLDD